VEHLTVAAGCLCGMQLPKEAFLIAATPKKQL
jgi:hypothetical protein